MEKAVFERTPFDINTAGSEGNQITVSYRVAGFWSSDKVNVYIRRIYGKTQWEVTINSSSGGCDTDYDSVAGIRNFAAALLDAADLAELVRANTDKLDANYEEYRARMRAEFEAA